MLSVAPASTNTLGPCQLVWERAAAEESVFQTGQQSRSFINVILALRVAAHAMWIYEVLMETNTAEARA